MSVTLLLITINIVAYLAAFNRPRIMDTGMFVPTTTDSNHHLMVSPNLLERNFITCARGQVWVSDITYIPTLEGFIYLTIILDLYDRKIVGWSISGAMSTQETILPAWYMAICYNVASYRKHS